MIQSASLEEALSHLIKLNPSLYSDFSLSDLRKATGIYLGYCKVQDEDLAHLAPLCELENIKSLNLIYSRLTGAGFKHIVEQCGQWKSITNIDLGGSPLVDEYLVRLNAFPNLETLNLDFHDENSVSQITGDFFEHVKLNNLKFLHAVGISVTDKNALKLLTWPALEAFRFEQTPLSLETLEKLGHAKIDITAKWNLRRVQYEGRNPMSPFTTYERGLAISKKALQDNLITEEALQYAIERNLGVSIMMNRVFKLTDFKEESKDL